MLCTTTALVWTREENDRRKNCTALATMDSTDHTTTWTDVLGDAGWTTRSKPWRDPVGNYRTCRTLSRRSCSSTDENDDTSSLTGLRPTWIVVQGVVSVDRQSIGTP